MLNVAKSQYGKSQCESQCQSHCVSTQHNDAVACVKACCQSKQKQSNIDESISIENIDCDSPLALATLVSELTRKYGNDPQQKELLDVAIKLATSNLEQTLNHTVAEFQVGVLEEMQKLAIESARNEERVEAREVTLQLAYELLEKNYESKRATNVMQPHRLQMAAPIPYNPVPQFLPPPINTATVPTPSFPAPNVYVDRQPTDTWTQENRPQYEPLPDPNLQRSLDSLPQQHERAPQQDATSRQQFAPVGNDAGRDSLPPPVVAPLTDSGDRQSHGRNVGDNRNSANIAIGHRDLRFSMPQHRTADRSNLNERLDRLERTLERLENAVSR